VPEPNPYEPGSSARAPAPIRLFSPVQIFAAAFLGTPVTGLCLLSLNRRRMGRMRPPRTPLVLGIAMTAMYLAAPVVQPFGLLAGAGSLSVWYFAHQDVDVFEAHLARGGQRESSVTAVGLGLVGLVAYTFVRSVILIVFGEL
jgi:hypothetical protein